MAKVEQIEIGNFRVVKDPKQQNNNIIELDTADKGNSITASIVATNLSASIGSLGDLASMIRLQSHQLLIELADKHEVPLDRVGEALYPSPEELFEIIYP